MHAESWNDWLYQWIAYANWNYSRVFDITSDQIEGKTVWLKCDGLDTVANVRYPWKCMFYGLSDKEILFSFSAHAVAVSIESLWEQPTICTGSTSLISQYVAL